MTPSASPVIVTVRASAADAAPRGIGLPGFVTASRGASTRSLRAPIDAWSASMTTATRNEVGRLPPASWARTPVVAATRSVGNGWVSRRSPATRSDVDELREVRDEVVDQAGAAVPDPRSQAGHERMQGHGRHNEVARAVASEGRGRATAGCEHPFEFGFAQLRLAPEVGDDLDDPAT